MDAFLDIAHLILSLVGLALVLLIVHSAKRK